MEIPTVSILVDMDGVVTDFDGGFLQQWRRDFPEAPYVSLDQRRTFYVAHDYPSEQRSQVESIYTRPGFFRNLPAVPGAIEGLIALQARGHRVMLCTSPLASYKNCVEEKYDWVAHNLGQDWVKRLLLTRDKTQIMGAILVDDKPEVTGEWEPTWEHIVFDQPYNRHVTNKRRLAVWADWRQII